MIGFAIISGFMVVLAAATILLWAIGFSRQGRQ